MKIPIFILIVAFIIISWVSVFYMQHQTRVARKETIQHYRDINKMLGDYNKKLGEFNRPFTCPQPGQIWHRYKTNSLNPFEYDCKIDKVENGYVKWTNVEHLDKWYKDQLQMVESLEYFLTFHKLKKGET